MNRTTIPITLLLCSLLLGACEYLPTDSSTGTLTGQAELLDVKGRALPDQSGTLVRIEGTQLRTMTMPDGSWSIDGVPAGNYVVHFTQIGYGEIRQYVQFVGEGRLNTERVFLFPLPEFGIESIRIDPFKTGNDWRRQAKVTVELPPINGEKYVRSVGFFWSKSPSVPDELTSENMLGTVLCYGPEGIDVANNPRGFTVGTYMLDESRLRELGFAPGTTVYLHAFAANKVYGYREKPSMRLIYTTLDLSKRKRVEVVVP